MSCLGPIAQPTRQPVAENDLPADPIVIVRFHKLSRVAIRMCSLSNVRQSYCSFDVRVSG